MKSQVSMPCDLVVPISFYAIPSQLHTVLRNYKDGASKDTRRQFRVQTAAVLGHFLSLHRSCIERAAGRSWTVITTVPSTRIPNKEHALVKAMRLVPGLFAEYETLLASGPSSLGHNMASDTGYEVIRDVARERVLLVDDTWTSGARAQSAASALRLAGAEVVAIVVVGRVIDPEYDTDTKGHWRDLRAGGFDFDICCIH